MEPQPTMIFIDQQPSTSEIFLKPYLHSYFKKQSDTLESQIFPHVSEKLFEDTHFNALKTESIDELSPNQFFDEKLEKLIHAFITDALEEAFKSKDNHLSVYKEKHDKRINQAYQLLISTIIGGIFTVLTGILTTYFTVRC